MGASFGKNKKQTNVAAQENTVLRLKLIRDDLKQYQQERELNVESDLQLAKRSIREGNNEAAKTYLRKKRYHEQQIRNSQTQLDKIEQLTHELEFLQIENAIRKIGKKKEKRSKWKSFLKRKNKQRPKRSAHNDSQIPVDRSKKKQKGKTIASTKDEIEKQKRISLLISAPLRMDDDEAVNAELEAILDSNYHTPHVPKETFTYFEDKFLEQSDRSKELTLPNPNYKLIRT